MLVLIFFCFFFQDVTYTPTPTYIQTTSMRIEVWMGLCAVPLEEAAVLATPTPLLQEAAESATPSPNKSPEKYE